MHCCGPHWNYFERKEELAVLKRLIKDDVLTTEGTAFKREVSEYIRGLLLSHPKFSVTDMEQIVMITVHYEAARIRTERSVAKQEKRK